jgi:hypothetical protein
MNRIDLGQTIGILANLDVIAGIVFLAIEIQQNTESLTESRNLDFAQAEQQRKSQLEDSFRSLANSEYLPGLFIKNRAEGRDALNEEELQQFIW